MALVAYDYASSSENEEEDSQNSNSVIIPNKNANKEVNTLNETKTNKEIDISDDESDVNVEHSSKNESATSKHLFSTLPESKSIVAEIVEDNIEDFVPKPSMQVKKQKQKVKITIPSLSQFQDDDDEPEVKKVKLSSKGSGLMSLLPPVKGAVKSNTTFVPKAVSNKNKQTVTTPSANSLIPDSVKKHITTKKATLSVKSQTKVKIVSSDAESDDELDFDVPETYDDDMWEKICGRPKNKPIIQKPEEPPPQEINIAPEPEKPYDGLDNIAFKELVGKSRRPIGNIKLIDINEDEILPDKDIWMAKSLTDPEMAPKAVVGDPVDPTRKKKHHITYLAQQAKANEQDLKNQWAASKTNKFASRAKYGF